MNWTPFIRARVAYESRLARIGKHGLKDLQKPGKRRRSFDFRLLGPLEVRAGRETLALGGPKQRALLALLLLNANEVVSRDRLIDAVWGERQPNTIGAVLNVYLSKLRRLLGSSRSGAALVKRAQGYVLEVDPEQIDLHRFERLVNEGREALAAGDVDGAAARLGRALRMWRGRPLEDLADLPFADAESARFEELRSCALENRVEADLGLGRHLELVPELEALVASQPLRERPRTQLMVALYGAGRQAEALAVFREGRRLLAEELGIDPGPELRWLEQAILRHDPSLMPRPAPRGSPAERGGRRVTAIALAGALLLAAAASALALRSAVLPGGEDPTATVLAGGDDVAVLQPETDKVVARVPVGSNPVLIREGDGSVWVASDDDQTVTQIDPESQRVVRTFGIGFQPDDLAARGGAVWAFDRENGVLVRLSYDEPWDRLSRPGLVGFERMALDDQAVWLGGGKRLIRVDASTGRVMKRATVPVALSGLAVGAGGVWAVSGPAGTLLRIDPRTAAIRDRIPLETSSPERPPRRLEIAADNKFVWVLNGDTSTVTQIDAEARAVVATLPLGGDGASARLAVGEGAAWISNVHAGTVTRIDANTEAITSFTVSGSDSLGGVAVAAGLVWVSVDRL
jgi:DNA-binding SARP family transcriptional activator/DNA-binding beta-propeller fold protein YncE